MVPADQNQLLYSLKKATFVPPERKGAGAVERGGLENRYTSNGIQGSNPCLSAITALWRFFILLPAAE